MQVKFELNNNAQLVFKKKRNVPFASWEQINEELDRLVKTGVLAKLQCSDWATPTVYEKKNPTNTWEHWKLTPSNKWRWKEKNSKSISREQESYSKQKYITGTLSKG